MDKEFLSELEEYLGTKDVQYIYCENQDEYAEMEVLPENIVYTRAETPDGKKRYAFFKRVESNSMTDDEKAKYIQLLQARNIDKIAENTTSIRFWVKFWSILTIIALIIYVISLLTNNAK